MAGKYAGVVTYAAAQSVTCRGHGAKCQSVEMASEMACCKFEVLTAMWLRIECSEMWQCR